MCFSVCSIMWEHHAAAIPYLMNTVYNVIPCQIMRNMSSCMSFVNTILSSFVFCVRLLIWSLNSFPVCTLVGPFVKDGNQYGIGIFPQKSKRRTEKPREMWNEWGWSRFIQQCVDVAGERDTIEERVSNHCQCVMYERSES